MFGYASNETEELMPLPIMLAHRLAKRLAAVRKTDVLPYLRPDGKTQVTVRYEDDAHGHRRPVEIERVLISTQHRDGLDIDSMLKPDLVAHVLEPILPKDLYDVKRLDGDKDFFYCNPTGKFVIGGPMGDTGLTGRKIIVDTYGGAAPHGGGAFSGKDPTKVDRSAAYAARYVAKNIVAAGLADALPDPGRVRDRRRAPDVGARRDVRHGGDSGRADRGARAGALRPASRPRSSATSICAGRSTRRRPRTATSAATTATSRGSAPTRRTRCALAAGLAEPAGVDA